MADHSDDKQLRVGLGFRLGLADAMLQAAATSADFVEIAPENYLGVGGRRARVLHGAKERWPVISHGLCGDLAGSAPLDRDFMDRLKVFLRQMGARWYSDHLCLTNVDGAQLHELIALPFNEDSVKRAAERIRIVQDILEMPLAVENVSAYATMPGSTMGEAEFVRAVVEEADCRLLLDVNNVFVNSVNFEFDPIDYIETLPLDKVLEVHVAGYYEEEPDLLLDTHAAPISDPVYDLFREAWRRLPVRPPVLLERDGNFPPLAELEAELGRLLKIMDEVDTEALELPRETHTTVL